MLSSTSSDGKVIYVVPKEDVERKKRMSDFWFSVAVAVTATASLAALWVSMDAPVKK